MAFSLRSLCGEEIGARAQRLWTAAAAVGVVALLAAPGSAAGAVPEAGSTIAWVQQTAGRAVAQSGAPVSAVRSVRSAVAVAQPVAGARAAAPDPAAVLRAAVSSAPDPAGSVRASGGTSIHSSGVPTATAGSERPGLRAAALGQRHVQPRVRARAVGANRPHAASAGPLRGVSGLVSGLSEPAVKTYAVDGAVPLVVGGGGSPVGSTPRLGARPRVRGHRHAAHRSSAPASSSAAASVEVAPPPVAPGAAGAAGGGGGIGAAPAIGLLGAAAVSLLQVLLAGRLALELLPWRSTPAALPPERPG